MEVVKDVSIEKKNPKLKGREPEKRKGAPD